ncbi:MAG: DUF2794 domain-containing protein [Alphaproteobacteria bacterium]|nr:DUF2794 domain-containing protein [Alphaproteobacteria bacterium]
MSEVLHLAKREPRTFPRSRFSSLVAFHRNELNQILAIYSRMVIAGEWCDYALNIGEQEAAFAIYRRRSPVPAYRVVKRVRSGAEGRRYRVVEAGGRVLKEGANLGEVLPVLLSKRLRLAS